MFLANVKKPFHTRSEMNRPRVEGDVDSRLYRSRRSNMQNRMQEKQVQHYSEIKKDK